MAMDLRSLIIVGVILSGCIQIDKGINHKMLTEESAIKIASNNAGGFLGTWVQAKHIDGHWHISAFSKSAKPPMYYILDAKSGAITLKLENGDDPREVDLLFAYLRNHSIDFKNLIGKTVAEAMRFLGSDIGKVKKIEGPSGKLKAVSFDLPQLLDAQVTLFLKYDAVLLFSKTREWSNDTLLKSTIDGIRFSHIAITKVFGIVGPSE